jgi:hypothetical protein
MAAHGTTHGLTGHPLFRKWNSIMQRCYNPKQDNYPRYGGRGITVEDTWQDVRNFIRDIETFRLIVEPPYCGLYESNYPPKNYSIDRIDTFGPYSFNNCRWADKKLQTANRTYIDRNCHKCGLPYTPNSSKQKWCDRCVSTISKAMTSNTRRQPTEPSDCVPACWYASHAECTCPCGGENHGIGHPPYDQ